MSEERNLALVATGGGVLHVQAADRALSIADQTQGAVLAADGSLWLTQSSGKFGRLRKIGAGTGSVMATYAMPAGIDDIDPEGCSRGVSEAGSQRWNAPPTYFPLVFAIDVNALQ